jgi:hypothetical protein
MKLSKEARDGITINLIHYGQYCLMMGSVGGVMAILKGGLPVLFSIEFLTIWLKMDLVLAALLLMIGVIGAVAIAACWLVSRPFGETGREWFNSLVRHY